MEYISADLRTSAADKKIHWALNTSHSVIYTLGDTLDLLSLAAQHAAMLSNIEAAQIVNTTLMTWILINTTPP